MNTKFNKITEEMNALYVKKNHDYGDSFHDTFKKLGIVSSVTRLYDKMNRLVSLTSKHEQLVNDESIRDTLIDIANYSVMTIMEIDNQKEKEEWKR